MAHVFRVQNNSEQMLVAALADAVRSGNFEPPQLPHIAMKILKLTRDPNVSMRAMGRLLSRDQMLTAKVLHLANSALFCPTEPISSPARAMAHIGLDGLKQMLFAFAFKGSVFRCREYQADMQQMWVASVGCALASDMVAKARKKPMHMAFVAGLLHDIGKPVALSTFLTLKKKHSNMDPSHDLVLELTERVHAKLGGLIASKWKLPPEVRSVIMNHHRADVVKGDAAELTRVVAAADRLCQVLCIGYTPPEGRRLPKVEELLELHELGIAAEQTTALATQLLERAKTLSAEL